LYGITPDLTTLGKIIRGGLPVGAYGGKREIMNAVSPLGPVYQAGTLSGNPLAMAAGLAMLTYLQQNPDIYSKIDAQTTSIVSGIRTQATEAGLNYTVNQVGSMFTLFFTDQPVYNFDSAKTADTGRFASYFQAMLQQGIYFPPSQYEAAFVSAAIDDQIVDRVLSASRKALESI
jgi:glutamate-1-semialdehyde 2,1-aminomutase